MVDQVVLYFFCLWLFAPAVVKLVIKPEGPFILEYFKDSRLVLLPFILYLMLRLI